MELCGGSTPPVKSGITPRNLVNAYTGADKYRTRQSCRLACAATLLVPDPADCQSAGFSLCRMSLPANKKSWLDKQSGATAAGWPDPRAIGTWRKSAHSESRSWPPARLRRREEHGRFREYEKCRSGLRSHWTVPGESWRSRTTTETEDAIFIRSPAKEPRSYPRFVV